MVTGEIEPSVLAGVTVARGGRCGFVLLVGAGCLIVGAARVGVTAAQESRSVLDGVYTGEQAGRGEQLYEKECASCHGGALQGVESATALTGSTFLANWNGLTLGDLMERTRQSMPPDDPSRLSRAQNADILSYILKVGKYPAGATALPAETGTLKQIQIRPVAP